jgi:hypothetical protein
MENELAIAIIPFSIRLFSKNYDSRSIKLDQAMNELLTAIKSKHACQISSLITPIRASKKDSNDCQDFSIRFVIWGPIANVSGARKELLRCNLSEVSK